MTNQEKLNQIMNDMLEYARSPQFFEDKGGTGDFPNYLQPTSTATPTPQPVAPKLCPFRKLTFFKSGNDVTVLQYAQYMDEEFQPCLREQCAVWNERMGACTY